MNLTIKSLVLVILLASLAAHAQLGVLRPVQPPPADTIVNAVADELGLTLVFPDQLPRGATYWWVLPGGSAVPTPCPPMEGNAPIYQIADGQYLADQTGGQLVLNPNRFAMQSSAAIAAAVQTQAQGLIDLVNSIQENEVVQGLRIMAQAMGIDLPGGGGGGDGSGFGTVLNASIQIDPNGLWLEITNVSNGWSYLNLHNPTNRVYALLTKTNLLDATWMIEQEVWPTNTAVMPLAVQNFDRQPLFFRVEDWTGVTHGGNTTPDWWLWQYFGTTALTDTNQDASGNTLANDYSNNITPTVFSFTGIQVANNNANTSLVPMQMNVTGNPYYIAVLVDDTNFNAATWDAYVSPYLTLNLGATEGWHEIWIGLRGHADDPSSAVWQWQRLKLSLTPPQLVITGPTNNPATVPLIQLTGYSVKALSRISYDISNAAGTATNQQIVVTGQAYNTSTMEFSTNYFQGYDVPLTNGVNSITIHATDLAGNVATLTTNIVCTDNTNLPGVNLIWPQNGMQVVGSSFTIQGAVDDPTATVTLTTVDASGNTNILNGRTGRDGIFWIENVPLNPGTNYFTVTLSNPMGDTTTNFSLIQNNGNLSVNDVQAGQTNVTGSVNPGYTVWVNGVQAINNGDGTWTAPIAPIGIGGGLVQVTAIPNTDNGGSGSGGGSSVNPQSTQSLNTQITVQPPQGVFISAYHNQDKWNGLVYDDWNETWVDADWHYNLDWQDGQGGKADDSGYQTYYYDWKLEYWYPFQETMEWPASQWPQPLPQGTKTATYFNDEPRWATPPNTQTNAIEPPGLAQEHCDFYHDLNNYYNALAEQKTSDTEMKLATGGPLGSTQKNLWCISANARDEDTGLPIPPEQISIGSFGNLDTNGNLYVVLPDNDPPTVTPTAPRQNYTFSTPTETKCTLEAPSVVPDQGVLVATNPNIYLVAFCPGSFVTVSGTPCCETDPRALVLYWSMTGGLPYTNTDGTIDLTKRLVDRSRIGAVTITVNNGGLSKTIKVIIYQAKFEIDADAGNCLPDVGHAWWNLSIVPSDAAAFIPSHLQYAQGIAGYFDHCQPQGIGQVIFGTQTDRCGGGGVHPTTGSYWWCISFGSYINALGKVDQLNQWPGMYDVLGNNCVAQAMAVGGASGVSVGYNGIQPCGLSECLNQLIMSPNPGPPQCYCTQ